MILSQLTQQIGAEWLELQESGGVITVLGARGISVEDAQRRIDVITGRTASVTPAQIRVWLVSRGISLAQTEQFIAAIPDPMTREIARIKWEYGVTVLRTDPLVVAFARALGMTDEQMDAAFEEASRL